MIRVILFHFLFGIFLNIRSQVCLSSFTNYPAGNTPNGINKGDFNGDGNLDLVISNQTANTASFLFGNGAGNFASPVSFTVGQNPFGIATGDFNLDGYTDAAVANVSSDNISILISTGTGSFFVTTYTLNSTAGPGGIVSADFNSDGKLDLATNNLNTNNVSVLIGNGLGGFSSPTNFTVDTKPYSVTATDFNSDGKIDIATSNFYGSISILLSIGSGSFANAVTFPGGSRAITSGDFNNDGKPDIASTSMANIASVFIATGSTNFATATNYTVGSTPFTIVTADFNGDGNTDLATSNQGSSNISVLIGDGFGNFNLPATFNVGPNPTSLISGDFNNDGKADIATANFGGTTASVLLNNPSGVPPLTVINTPTIVCAGESATLSASGSTNFLWSSGATTPSIIVTPTATTIYSVNTFDSYGCANSGILTQSVSACIGIDELKNEYSTIYVFPNPSVEKVSIKSDKACKLKLINMYGQILICIDLTIENNYSFILDNLKSGTYTLINEDHHFTSQKLIVIQDR